MFKPRSYEVNKPKASHVRVCFVPPTHSRAARAVVVEFGISNVKMKKEVRTRMKKSNKKGNRNLKKIIAKARARATAAQNRKKDGPFDVERMIFFLSLLSLSKIQT
jgi:hypothetical protein